jgi:N-acetylglucosaminyldiphosphoundecaprenol N-acetyl-beta-D-mannosaminyltransferase
VKRINLFGCPVDVATMQKTVDAIEHRIDAREFTQHVVVNVAKLVSMQDDAELAASVHECDIINIDGMGVVFGARFLGHDIPERVAGVDLFHELLGMASRRDFPVYFLGATREIVERTAQVCRSANPGLRIAGYHDGYFWADEEKVVAEIRASGAKLLFVAISSPLKENFINRWKDALGVDFVMGVGGTFDVVAGKVARAPVWMQRIGFEWLYRLIQEPRRMWRRYLGSNLRFAVMLCEARLKLRRA